MNVCVSFLIVWSAEIFFFFPPSISLTYSVHVFLYFRVKVF